MPFGRSVNLYRVTRIHSAYYAVDRCQSVRPYYVCLIHTGILSTRLNITANFCHSWVAIPFPVFPQQTAWYYSNWKTTNGVDECEVYDKWLLLTDISLYQVWKKRQKLLWKANRKPHPSFRIILFSVTFSDLLIFFKSHCTFCGIMQNDANLTEKKHKPSKTKSTDHSIPLTVHDNILHVDYSEK